MQGLGGMHGQTVVLSAAMMRRQTGRRIPGTTGNTTNKQRWKIGLKTLVFSLLKN